MLTGREGPLVLMGNCLSEFHPYIFCPQVLFPVFSEHEGDTFGQEELETQVLSKKSILALSPTRQQQIRVEA
jgi:hypothetical protein